MRHTFHHRGIISPNLVNALRFGREDVTGKVKDGVVVLDPPRNETLTFDAPCPYPDGTSVALGMERNFYCESHADIQAAEAARIARMEAQRQAGIDASWARYRRIEEANKPLRALPFSWVSGFRPVLSGLRPNSMCNGLNVASVMHIELAEEFTRGRLVRSEGDFLCSRDKGKAWVDSICKSSTPDGKQYDYEITCKACLKRARNMLEKLA